MSDLLELILRIVVEVICNWFWWGPSPSFSEETHPIWSTIGLMILGCFLGGISMLLQPHPLFSQRIWQLVALCTAPALGGTTGYVWETASSAFWRISNGVCLVGSFCLVRFFMLKPL